MAGWDWMKPVNEGQPKIKNGVKLNEQRRRISIISHAGRPGWGWDCPYMRCGFELRTGALVGHAKAEAERDAHLAERHPLVKTTIGK